MEFLGLDPGIPVIDVRTPSEFERGHIPGSLNIPLFSDSERAVVGTIYKKEGKEKAVLAGLDFVGPRMSTMLKEGLKEAGKRGILALYCWRGGMRSESMGWLFGQGGLKSIILEGGYKAYRNHILNSFSNLGNVIIIGGLTGSGKTDILKELAKMGEQVIDLEGIANHRGSAFGAIGMPPQPTSEHFANILFSQLVNTDTGKRLFLEDESRNIGTVFMPDEIYDSIRSSPLIAIMTDTKTRMPRLLGDYGKHNRTELVASLQKIQRRLGGDRTAEAISSVESGDIERAIEIVLGYYDKAYLHGLSTRTDTRVMVMETTTGDAAENALKVIELLKREFPERQ